MNNFAFALKESGKVAEAEEIYRRALERTARSPDPNSFLTTITRDSLAMCLLELDRVEEAEPLLRICVTDLSQQRGPDQPATLRESYKLVDALIRLGKCEEANRLSRELRSTAENNHPIDAPIVAIGRAAEARALLAAGAIKDARVVVDACIRDCPPRSPGQHYLLASALDQLREACQRVGWNDVVVALGER